MIVAHRMRSGFNAENPFGIGFSKCLYAASRCIVRSRGQCADFDTASARGLLAVGYARGGRDAEAIREFKTALPIMLAASRENADDDTTLVAARSQRLQTTVESYIGVLARDQGKSLSSLTPTAMKRLETYDFPGNVRELENILERAVALTRGGRIELDALQSQLRSAEDDYRRFKSLAAKGYATESRVNDLERQMIAVRKELDIRRVELASRVELAEQNLGKRLYSGNQTIGSADITGKGAELEAEVRLAEFEIQLAQQRHISWLNQRDRASVRAPFDGVILELPKLDNGHVRKGDVIAIVEQRKQRHVTAFLTQDEVLKVGVGDEVLLYVPAVDETVKGRVTVIDRTTGFIREQGEARNPGYAWRGPTDRSAKITIEFAEPAKVADADRFRSGLPVVAVFEQRSTNSLLSSIKKTLSLAL